MRQLARDIGFASELVVSLGDKSYGIFPWLGTIPFNTLLRYLKYVANQQLQISAVNATSPFCIKLFCAEGAAGLRNELVRLPQMEINDVELLGANEVPEMAKFDLFLPDHLKRKSFAADHLDVKSLKDLLI